MQSKSNLIPIKKGQLSKEEAKARGSNGGKASVIARKEKRLFKEILEDILEEEVKYGDRMITKKMAWAYKIVTNSLNRVNNGKLDAIDIKAFEMGRDTIGEKPTDKSETKYTGTIILNFDSEDKKA